MKPLLEIVKLNQTRYGTDFNGDTAVAKLKEELQELQDAIEINNITWRCCKIFSKNIFKTF